MPILCRFKQFYNTINFAAFSFLGIALYLAMGVWCLGCEFVIYEKNYFFSENKLNDILLSTLSWIIHHYCGALIIILSMIPLALTGVFENNESNEKKINYYTPCKLLGYLAFSLIISCIYFTYFWLETKFKKVNNIPDVFSFEATKFVECGFLKTLPGYSILAYAIYTDKLPGSNKKIHIVKSLDDNSKV